MVTRRLKVTTRRPKRTTRRLKVTTRRPRVTTRRPKVTTRRPRVTYLLGFRANEAILLCTVDTGSTSYGTLTHVATYEGFESAAEWRYGVGLQICGARKIRIFGC